VVGLIEHRTAGSNGLELSVVGLGCNNFGMKLDRNASASVVRAAVDLGVTHFDTAEMYGNGQSEEFLGAALGSDRDRVVVATKFSPRPKDVDYRPGALAARIREACEGSLRRLGSDWIDLYYQHYPDLEAPPEEATETLAALVAEGKVLFLGNSNVDADQLRTAGPSVAVTEIEWNLLSRAVEREIVPSARGAGIGIVPYFPLASGLLTGKYRKGDDLPAGSRLATMPYFRDILTDENLDRVERLTEFATEHGHSILELAVAWLLAQTGVVSVITGATSPEQVEANVGAVGWQLSPADLAEIGRRLEPAAGNVG
jgi:aryl-alcohol dehydrogenase-like predicted oxidoreductase